MSTTTTTTCVARDVLDDAGHARRTATPAVDQPSAHAFWAAIDAEAAGQDHHQKRNHDADDDLALGVLHAVFRFVHHFVERLGCGSMHNTQESC